MVFLQMAPLALQNAKGLIAQLRRHGAKVSLLMIDVDHFKRLNDTSGHLAGDAVLRNLAKLLDGTLRDMDFLTRYGGEKFVAVLPGTDLHHARLGAGRNCCFFRRADEVESFNVNDGPVLKSMMF